jgi:hypothetical protein
MSSDRYVERLRQAHHIEVQGTQELHHDSARSLDSVLALLS